MFVHEWGTVGASLLTSFTRFAEKPAVADGRVCWSYGDLRVQVARCIAVFKAHGIVRGDALAVLSSNRAEVLAITSAASLMGLRFTPLHPLAGEEDQAFVLNHAEISVLVVEPDLFGARAQTLARSAEHIKCLFSFGPLEGGVDLLAALSNSDPAPLKDESAPSDIALIAYTGGTTGKPKGVVLSQRSIVASAYIAAHEWEWPEDIRFLATTPISHAAGAALRPVMLRGGFTRLERGFSPERFLDVIATERITATFLVPTMIYKLLDECDVSGYDLSALKTIIYGAAPMAPERLKQALDAFGPVFVQFYGQTEAPPAIATLRKAEHDPYKPDLLRSCGMASSCMAVKLFNANMQEVGAGEPGEICVRGPIVMDGYWKDQAATEAAFRGGWLHTGDVAIKDHNGYLTIVDRLKDMIISGGFNIYPRDVEDVLLSHEGVVSAAVVAAPDARWGEAVTAFIVVRDKSAVSAEALCGYVRERKGAPWAPKAIHVVDALPLTPIGKIDRKALRSALWRGQSRQVA